MLTRVQAGMGGTAMLSMLLAASALSATAPGREAWREPDPACAVTRATVFVRRFADLPREIREDLLRIGPIAEAGQAFAANEDEPDPRLPARRFVIAGVSDLRWFVWIDHGGPSRHAHVRGYDPLYTSSNDTPTLVLVADFVGEPCEAINAFLRGVMSNLDDGESTPLLGH